MRRRAVKIFARRLRRVPLHQSGETILIPHAESKYVMQARVKGRVLTGHGPRYSTSPVFTLMPFEVSLRYGHAINAAIRESVTAGR